eukprot:7782775-Karenia_brevis.AAC.1
MAMWYGTWSPSGFTAHDLMETHAEPIGRASNNVAEYAGCVHSLTLILNRVLQLQGHLTVRSRGKSLIGGFDGLM